MPLVFYKEEAADRGKVTFVHYNPERLSAQERALGISVDAVPEFDRLSGKSVVLYINPQTGDLWHEYVDIPTTQWVQRNEMIALMEGMPGSGVATESTLVEAVESLEGVEAKVATAAKQDAATAVLDAISTAVATRATEATLEQIKTALTDGTLKAQLSGSLVETDMLRGVKQAKMTIETIVNAATVASQARTNMAAVPNQGASQVWALVNIDQQPWSLEVGQGIHYPGGTATARAYPERSGANATYPNVYYPAVSLLLPFAMQSAMGLPTVSSLTEALLLAGPTYDNQQLAVWNKSSATATVTLKIVRVWR